MGELALLLRGGCPELSEMGGDHVQPGIEDVEHEAAFLGQVVADAAQGPALVRRGHQVQERPEGDDDEVETPVEGEGAHVALDQLDALPRRFPKPGELLPGGREHRRRAVEAHHRHPGMGDRDQDAPGAAAQLQDRRPGLPGFLYIEGHVAALALQLGPSEGVVVEVRGGSVEVHGRCCGARLA